MTAESIYACLKRVYFCVCDTSKYCAYARIQTHASLIKDTVNLLQLKFYIKFRNIYAFSRDYF